MKSYSWTMTLQDPALFIIMSLCDCVCVCVMLFLILLIVKIIGRVLRQSCWPSQRSVTACPKQLFIGETLRNVSIRHVAGNEVFQQRCEGGGGGCCLQWHSIWCCILVHWFLLESFVFPNSALALSKQRRSDFHYIICRLRVALCCHHWIPSTIWGTGTDNVEVTMFLGCLSTPSLWTHFFGYMSILT